MCTLPLAHQGLNRKRKWVTKNYSLGRLLANGLPCFTKRSQTYAAIEIKYFFRVLQQNLCSFKPFRDLLKNTHHFRINHTANMADMINISKSKSLMLMPPFLGFAKYLARAREPPAFIIPVLARHCSKLTGISKRLRLSPVPS